MRKEIDALKAQFNKYLRNSSMAARMQEPSNRPNPSSKTQNGGGIHQNQSTDNDADKAPKGDNDNEVFTLQAENKALKYQVASMERLISELLELQKVFRTNLC